MYMTFLFLNQIVCLIPYIVLLPFLSKHLYSLYANDILKNNKNKPVAEIWKHLFNIGSLITLLLFRRAQVNLAAPSGHFKPCIWYVSAPQTSSPTSFSVRTALVPQIQFFVGCLHKEMTACWHIGI